MAELVYKDESYAIIGAAMEVYNELGPGFLEAVYQEALELELVDRKIPFTPQHELTLHYKNRPLKKLYIPDFVVYGKIIVELKAQLGLTPIETAQVINYIKATGYELGILINFCNPNNLEYKRLIKAQKLGTTNCATTNRANLL